MRRYDLLDEYTTAIAPGLAPRAPMTARPGMRRRTARGLATASSDRPARRAAPVVLVALVCILLAFI